MAKVKKEDVLDYLESASMLEVSELISDIEEKFGVSAAAPVAVAAGPAAGGDAGGAEEKSDFNIELSSVGDKKINVIKVIREITALGLKEAKDLADGAPSIIKESVPADEANEAKAKLEEAGATVALK
ncbi:MAG: 50S ribosomal protein L7/L12 [Candidatus Marinimicrobia bacterium]|nr:50S ribosomal protein L7/L12 [Candidatus Neomarinimicrobiota bacterium]|tara:strand:- start:8184 stop:8567 length:384 start_codon:yes stop_codon:yes gene_type:complete